MDIIDFKQDHVSKARKLALDNYGRERQLVKELPENVTIPDLNYFAEIGLGAAAVEGSTLLGYLCAYPPREDAFATTNVRGTFVPIHAHAVTADRTEKDRMRIYSLLYQAAADKWVKAGIRSHAIALYTYDKTGIQSFFYNGFGLRCIDLIRSLEELPKDRTVIKAENQKLEDNQKPEYVELFRDEWGLLLDQHNALINHLGNSPSFMRFEILEEDLLYRQAQEDVRYFAAKVKGKFIAYIKLSEHGENFATEADDMMNICGAYCEPAYRSTGIYHNLLCYVMRVLRKEGFIRLGVDCESFNPTARGFWLKYFKEYTHSVVRRIDEKAVDLAISDC